MSPGDGLGVWLGGLRIGLLLESSGRRLTFQYDSEHLARGDPASLSLSLPLREPPFDDEQARPFFANLLPDAGLREAVARKLGLSPGNDFALLAALGGECAGAVSLLPAGEAPDPGGEYLPLSDDEFDRLVEELPVVVEGERILIARGGLATTHIVKPEIPGVEGSVRNQAFCMALAGRCSLPVPRSWVRPGRRPVYVVERFDRLVGEDGTVIRRHAEDLCQALGHLPTVKYESEGGPGLADAFSLLQRHSTHPALDRLALLRWTVFNTLILNADAHAKNLSLLHEPGGVRLAPFYDLLCTAAYPDLASNLAMKIGGEGRPAWLRRRHLERFAEQVEIAPRLVFDTIAQLAASLPELAAALAAEQADAFGPAPVVDRVVVAIGARCAQAERPLALPGEGS